MLITPFQVTATDGYTLRSIPKSVPLKSYRTHQYQYIIYSKTKIPSRKCEEIGSILSTKQTSQKHMPSLPVRKRTSNHLSSLANLSKQNNFYKRLTRKFGWNLALKKYLKINQALGIVLTSSPTLSLHRF